jgi:hypothetical protein
MTASLTCEGRLSAQQRLSRGPGQRQNTARAFPTVVSPTGRGTFSLAIRHLLCESIWPPALAHAPATNRLAPLARASPALAHAQAVSPNPRLRNLLGACAVSMRQGRSARRRQVEGQRVRPRPILATPRARHSPLSVTSSTPRRSPSAAAVPPLAPGRAVPSPSQ